MKPCGTFTCWLVGAVCATALHAQPPRRVPIIAGAMGLNLLVEADGTLRSWGSASGEATYFGDGSDHGDRNEPTIVPGLPKILDAAVGFNHAVILAADGTVLTWGHNNNCELALPDDRRRLTPIPVNGVRNAVQVGASMHFSAAVIADGTVRVWGTNEEGLLANGNSGWQAPCAQTPVAVEGLTGVKKIAVSDDGVLVLKQDGTVWGWGANSSGRLCDGTTEQRNRPVQMQGIANAVDIAIGGNTIVVLADGTVRMCGVSNGASMANAPEGSKHVTPFKIAGITTAVAVAIAVTPMVRLKDGTLLGWGYGMHGRLGDGFIDKISPTLRAPIGLGPVLAHYYASYGGYAIRADGTVMAWGTYIGPPKEWALKPIPFYKTQLRD